jgi:hypothetical protein
MRFLMLRAVSLVAGLGIADAAVAGNLLLNPDFTAGREGWALYSATGRIDLIQDDGFPSGPSMRVAGDTGITGASAASGCVTIDASLTYDFALNVEPVSGHASGTVIGYSDPSCEDEIASIDTERTTTTGNLWLTLSLTDMSIAGRSARVVLNAEPDEAFGRGDAEFDHVLFGAHGTLADGIDLNQEGLTGAWYNPFYNGQGFQFTIGDGLLFGAWYTFDDTSGGAEHQRWYSLQAAIPGTPGSADVTIYENTSGNFDAPPSTSAHAVGVATLTFDSCTSGHFAFSLDDGRTGDIALQPLLPNVECVETGTPESPPSDFGYSGTWYDPSAGGQGMMITVNPIVSQVFGGWYTYTAHGAGSGAEGKRWFSLQGRYGVGHTSMDIPIYVTTGGTFGEGGSVGTSLIGEATLTFLSCNTATLDYAFDDGELAGTTGTIPLLRLGDAPASCSP